jgi:hypothetical protein
LSRWQLHWAHYLIQTKQYAQASTFLASLSPEAQKEHAADLVPLDLQIATQLGTLDQKIAGYKADPSTVPPSEVLRTSARKLFEAGDKQSARKILEFVFARELDEHQLVAANFLGLAEIRIASGDTPGALELLRRLVVALENPYQNLDSAAALLEKTGHNKEALEFLEPLSKATPWEPAFQLRLAKARIAAGQDAASGQALLAKIATDGHAAYETRVEAVQALAGAQGASDFGSAELNLLSRSSRGISPESANQPFFCDARLRAAQAERDPRPKLSLLGGALAETSSRDDARVPEFYAAAALNQNEFALAAIEPLLRDQRLLRTPPPGNNEEEEILGADETYPDSDADNAEEEASGSVNTNTKLTPAQQGQLARAVGEVFARLERLNEALPYLQLAQNLEKTAARLKEIKSETASVKSRLRQEQVNAARQPVLHADLEQDRVVRPRLVAQTTRATVPTVKAGEKP